MPGTTYNITVGAGGGAGSAGGVAGSGGPGGVGAHRIPTSALVHRQASLIRFRVDQVGLVVLQDLPLLVARLVLVALGSLFQHLQITMAHQVVTVGTLAATEVMVALQVLITLDLRAFPRQLQRLEELRVPLSVVTLVVEVVGQEPVVVGVPQG